MTSLPALFATCRPVVRQRTGAVLALAVAALVLLLPGAAGWADTVLVSSNPADGSTVAPPRSVVLTFGDPITSATVEVTGPGGSVAGQASVAGATVTRSVSTLSPGRYTVAYRVVAADGHPVRGGISFTVTASARPSASPPPGAILAPRDTTEAAPQPDEPSRIAPWLIGAGVLILLTVAALTIRTAMRRTSGDRVG